MNQVGSCLLEHDGWWRSSKQQQKSAPKAPSLPVGMSNRASSGSGSRSEPTGSGEGATADNSAIGNSCSGELPASSGGMDGSDSLANNGSRPTTKQAASYSKIFRQYLPYRLNLNYNGKSKRRSELLHLNTEECDGGASIRAATTTTSGLDEQLLCDTRSSCSSGRGSTKSIVNAFSRIKVAAQQQQHQTTSKSYGLKQARNFQEAEGLLSKLRLKHQPTSQHEGHQSSSAASAKSSGSSGHLIQPNRGGAKFPTSGLEATDLEAAKEVCTKSPKRKGFLYLKRSACTQNRGLIGQEDTPRPSVTSGSSAVSGLRREEALEEEAQPRGSGKLKRLDLNNNSISNLISSSCHQQDAEHRQCLLDDDHHEEEAAAAEAEEDLLREFCGRRIDNSTIISKGANKMMAGRTEAIGGKMSRNSSNKQESNNKNNYFTNRYTKRKGAAAAASGDPKALILGAGVVLMGLCLVFAGKLALAQQQSQPFSRSQSPVGGSLSVAMPPVAPIGGQSVGGGGNRPASPQPAAGSLVANINCNKIKGHVTLTPNHQGGTTVSTQISAGPPGEVYQWSVHQFPVKPGAAMCSCSPMILGTKLIDLSEMHGNLPSDQEFNVQSSINLFGPESPVGHSLLLRGMKTGMVACATFLPTSRKSNYRAKFHTPISGSVTIFQTAFGTSFIAHLMYSNGTRRHSMHRFDLVKSEDDMVTTSLLSGVPVGGSLSAGSSRAESLLLEQREHEHELSQCKRYANGEPLFNNMSYQLSVSTENFGMRGRTAMVLPQIPFETFASVFVIVYSELDPNEPIACAPLKFVKPKTAAAKFQSVSVQGSVTFSQDSPYDVTVARVSLSLPNSDGHSYGIDELPMIIRRKSDTRVCPNIREIIYNPHHVEPSSVPPEGEATSDQYAVGDLSGKYGSLTGKSSEKLQANDYNLPLYGPISIVGRAMTVYSAEGVAIACSNVELTTPMTTAFATFDYGIQGQFIFRQPVNDCNGDTYVYIEVSKPVVGSTGSQQLQQQQDPSQRSLDHNWHIHVNPVDSGLDHLSTTDCAPAGAHFNPYNTSTGSIYSRDCTPFNVLRCELGDMSAKMFTIEIPPYRVKGGQEPDIGKFFGTDIDLPLCGPVSIVNRSVVVHTQDFGHQRLACSTVIEFKPRTSS